MSVLSVLLFACAHNSQPLAQQHAEEIRHLIVMNDRAGFSRLEVFPGSSLDDDQLNWVFGRSDVPSEIRELLQRPSVEVGLFGPFEHADDTNGKAYHVLYYDSAVTSLAALTAEWGDGEKLVTLWGSDFVSTLLVEVEGRMQLYRTPFWYGTHIPGERTDY